MSRKNPIPAPPPFDPSITPGGQVLDPTVGLPVNDADEPEWVEMDNLADPPHPVDLLPPIAAEKEPPPVTEEDREIVAVVPIDSVPSTHHLVVGMGTLAAMSEADFAAKLAVMKSGQERIRTIQAELLTEGEDYGKVKGIARPFLQQPGAEKLANFYGFAVEQIAERVPGDGVTTPHLAYHVRSLIHLGDFTGPIVAQGYGEANSWEEKYRYRNATPTCPNCGRKGLVKRKSPPSLAGKWSCPTWNNLGGCNANFEPNDPRIEAGGLIENPDPYGLAETLIQMAAKRSLVAGVRRATGTSGLFTQDDDSPSVRQQAGEGPEAPTEPRIEAADPIGVPVAPGAKTTVATQVQHRRLGTLAKEKGLNGAKIAALLERLFGMEVEPTGAATTAAVKALDADQMGKLLHAVETGEVDAVDAAEAPSKATN